MEEFVDLYCVCFELFGDFEGYVFVGRLDSVGEVVVGVVCFGDDFFDCFEFY